jgi:hypothetical protein
MNRMVLGAFAALLMVAAGLFWWQGRAELARAVPPPDISGNPQDGTGPLAGATPIELPSANPNAHGSRLPRAARTSVSKEQARFNRYDRNRDGQISRDEMLGTRVKAFQKLDTNHDNMLSFEEWAVKTSDRFKEIDTNHDGVITPVELAAYEVGVEAKKKHRKLPDRCADGSAGGRGKPDARNPDDPESDGNAGDPAH